MLPPPSGVTVHASSGRPGWLSKTTPPAFQILMRTPSGPSTAVRRNWYAPDEPLNVPVPRSFARPGCNTSHSTPALVNDSPVRSNETNASDAMTPSLYFTPTPNLALSDAAPNQPLPVTNPAFGS